MLVITIVSVVVAVTASAVAWHVTRGERLRSAARVAALAAAAGVVAPTRESLDHRPVVEVPSGLQEFMPAREAGTESDAATVHGDTQDAPSPAPSIFGAPVADSGSGHRQRGLLAAAAVVAVLIGGSSLVLFVSGRTPSAASSATRAPLELMALDHTRADGQLVVSGLVQNPAAGRVVEQLEAHVRVFDNAGIMIATQFAPTDAPSLAPGQNVPFAVIVGQATTAARYRVSFASRGTILAHVDRRTNLPAAVTAEAR